MTSSDKSDLPKSELDPVSPDTDPVQQPVVTESELEDQELIRDPAGPAQPVPQPDVTEREHDAKSMALIRSAWRWAAATVFLFPLLVFWSLPAAALVSQRLAAGDVVGAKERAQTAKVLGITSVVIAVLLFVIWGALFIASVAVLEMETTPA